jgi:hypothetical protein
MSNQSAKELEFKKPFFTRGVVEAKAKLFFPMEKTETILKILDDYGKSSWEKATNRVHLAILKPGEGDIGRRCKFLDMARSDFRDVFSFAEYPDPMRIGFFNWGKLSQEEQDRIEEKDLNQYPNWPQPIRG